MIIILDASNGFLAHTDFESINIQYHVMLTMHSHLHSHSHGDSALFLGDFNHTTTVTILL
jgi:hypothetical protein